MRGRYEITAEILSTVRSPSSKTSIVYSANLSFGQAERYLDRCLEAGLIEFSREPTKKYQITEKGREFLNAFRKLKKIVERK